jgi:hypothetical protein
MATTTPNFGWPVPTSTDLVKDGATAIEALGDSIDASLLDLKGGTSGQVLAKNSNTDMDFIWVTDAAGDITGVTAGTGISGGGTSGTVTVTNSMATAIDAKGDLVAGTGSDAFARVAVGTNGQVLTADSTAATGLAWSTAAASKVAQVLSTIKTDTFSASITAGSNAAVTGLSQAITPSASTSKVLITLTMSGYGANSGQFGGFIARSTTPIGIGDAAGSRIRVGSSTYASPDHLGNITMTFLDSPATTSAVTYNAYVVNIQPTTRTVYVNRNETDTDAQDRTRPSSTITVMEILA